MEDGLYDVQSLEWDAPFSTEEWLCVKVVPKMCESFLRRPELQEPGKHVKRVKKVEQEGGEKICCVLVCKKDVNVKEGEVFLSADLLEVSGLPEQQVSIVHVPSVRPVRREQLPLFNSFWPCSYYEVLPDTALVSQLSSSTRQSYRQCMRWAIREAFASERGIGCVIVDGQSKVVGAGTDSRGPYDGHAVMNALRSVSNKLRQKDTSSSSSLSSSNSDMRDQLFCTQYTVFVTHEPCVMCCMALLHSRVATVVFASRCRVAGGLAGPEIRIGSNPKLNHHFNVYGGCCEDEAPKPRGCC